MINFSLIKSVTIPEGNVTQIADAQGNVLWSAAPAILTLTLSWKTGGNAWFDHSELGEEISDGTYEVSPGSTLTCWISSHLREMYYEIYVNGERTRSGYISSGYQKTTYEYTITKNITVTYSGDDANQYIYITET